MQSTQYRYGSKERFYLPSSPCLSYDFHPLEVTPSAVRQTGTSGPSAPSDSVNLDRVFSSQFARPSQKACPHKRVHGQLVARRTVNWNGELIQDPHRTNNGVTSYNQSRFFNTTAHEML